MKPISLSGLLLRLRLALQRVGPLRVAAAVLCMLAGLGWSWLLPLEEAALAASRDRLAARQRTLAAMPAQPPRAAPTTSQRNYGLFQAVLGESRGLPRHLQTLFDTARDHRLVLARGEYKLEHDAASGTDVYRVLIPVTGSYAGIRQFCETALQRMPFASLDEIGFRRDGIANAMPEARLRFTFYLRHDAQDNPAPPAAAPATGPSREADPMPVPETGAGSERQTAFKGE